MISTECERTGTDISIEEHRQAIAARVLNALERPKKMHKVDHEGHAVVTSVVGGSKLYHGTIDSSFRRKFTPDDALHFWNCFKQHHKV